MKPCAYCGKNIPDDVSFCSYCGKGQEQDTIVNMMWADTQMHLGKLEVYMDGELVAKAMWFKQNIFHVPAGKHIFYSKLGIFQSPPVEVVCEIGKSIQFITGVIQSRISGTLIRKVFGMKTMFLEEYKGPPDRHPLPTYDASILK